jgi:hypothetical protein
VKIDASRYRTFMTNPEEYRLRELWNLVPESSGGQVSCLTFGRRRGSAFHDLLDGRIVLDETYGADAVETAREMFAANKVFDAKFEENMEQQLVWREKGFCIPIEGSRHYMVGRADAMLTRLGEPFILDCKTTKARTKAEMQVYRDNLSQSPQVDFYLSAFPEARRFVFRVLWRDAKKAVQISELEVTRQKWELAAFQRGVHMVATLIEFWRDRFGIDKAWPRAISLPVAPERYQYASIYQRNLYAGMEQNLEGFETRREHLAVMEEDAEVENGV